MEKKSPPKLPPLSIEATQRVELVEDCVQQSLQKCANYQGSSISNPEKASRILRTLLIESIDAQLDYFSALPNYHITWVAHVAKRTIDSFVGLFPLYTSGEEFRSELTETAMAHIADRAREVGPARSPIIQADNDIQKRKRFDSLLIEKGWSILDWANEANVAYHTAADYLSGAKRPYRSIRAKLAKALGLPANQLPD